VRELLRQRLHAALEDCFLEGTLSSGAVPDIQLEVPGNPEHGDFATNLAMMLARAERKAPRQVAEALVAMLGDGGGLWRRLEIAGPGFINFTLAPLAWLGTLDEILRQDAAYGCSPLDPARKVQVEFVSACMPLWKIASWKGLSLRARFLTSSWRCQGTPSMAILRLIWQ